MGFGSWATFVLAAASLSAFKKRHELLDTLQLRFAQPSHSGLFMVWGLCLVISAAQMLLLSQGSRRGFIAKPFARKAIHMSMGPVYMLFWPLFPNDPLARYLCASVPLFSSVLVLLVGSGVLNDPALLEAASRSGRRQELLQGPLLYGMLHVAITVFMWRSVPAGITSLMMLCFGDGAAELFGVAFGSNWRLPYNKRKSIAGTSACLLFGFLGSYGMVMYFSQSGAFEADVTTRQLFFVALSSAVAGTIAESATNVAYENAVVVLVAAAGGQVAMSLSA